VQSRDPAFDIAVLKVIDVASAQPLIALGDAASLRLGEEVLAIGTPLGFLQNTVSRGIVSGVREVRGATLVQTDAAVNPGNSGGPLINRDGAVIGIVTSAYINSNGLAFAVSVDHIRSALAGRVSAVAAAGGPATPYDALTPAIAAPGDDRRGEATRAFEDVIRRVAVRADELDGSWKAFTATCYEGRIAGVFDRQWFALWDPRAMQGVVPSHCLSYFADLKRQANEIEQTVVTSDEMARRADLYPGTRRDVLRKYRLDYAGWSR
jgi:S1-C subfamily serine protease